MHLLVIAPSDFAPLTLLEDRSLDLTLSIGTTAGELRSAAARADAVLVAPRYGGVLRTLWPEMTKLRWLHTLAAGVEFLPFDLLRESDVLVTNSRGLYADALAEFAIASILWFARDMRRLMKNQEEHRWEPYTVERIEGQTAGIIGYGGIGRAVGRRAEALGMRLLTFRRTPAPGDVTLRELLSSSDFVVSCLPLTPATKGLLTADHFRTMKPSAVFINIGRGSTVDETALIATLRERRIRGAALDVFEKEPLEANHPLWQLENVLISPHSADHTSDAHERAMRFFLGNLERYRQGQTLENVVDIVEQY